MNDYTSLDATILTGRYYLMNSFIDNANPLFLKYKFIPSSTLSTFYRCSFILFLMINYSK